MDRAMTKTARASATLFVGKIRTFMYPDGGTRGAPTANPREIERYDRETRAMHNRFHVMCTEERAYWLGRAFPLPKPYDQLNEEEQASARLRDWSTVEPMPHHAYIELPPFGPQPAGQPGGDSQVSEAWSRTFARWIGPDEFFPDGDCPWAVIIVEFYVLDMAIAHATDDGPRLELVMASEFSRCAHLDDIGDTQGYVHTTDETIPGPRSTPPSEEIALGLCEGMRADMFTWNGMPITD